MRPEPDGSAEMAGACRGQRQSGEDETGASTSISTSERELVLLGTASQAATRFRNQNGYLLRWDGAHVLFDPGEGVQRQFSIAEVSAAEVNRICISHFHGDHCLGLPGMIMRLGMDQGHLPIPVHYPASGEAFFERLRFASAGQENYPIDPQPIAEPGVVHVDEAFTLRCARLVHGIESFGYRVEEPDGRSFIPERLHALGIEGADIGRLRSEGRVLHDGRTVTFEEVSVHRRGQVFAFIMDTALCDGAYELAADADLVVCESTFLSRDAHLARRYGHMTARQAGRLAREAGVRRLVLTHFSRRYRDETGFGDEAREEFADVVVGEDFQRIAVPHRR
jgi:ribonuclease Z